MPRKEEFKEERRKDYSLKEKSKLKEEKLAKKRPDEERVRLTREYELREEIRTINEEINKDKKREARSPSSSSDKKEKKEKKDPSEKKKKKEVYILQHTFVYK